MKRDWPGNSYHLTARNCNHFSEAMCKILGVSSFPGWVNRAAKVGDSLRGVVGDPSGQGAGGGGSAGPVDMPHADAKQMALAQEALKLKKTSEHVDLFLAGAVDVSGVGCLNQSSNASKQVKQLFAPFNPKNKPAGRLPGERRR